MPKDKLLALALAAWAALVVALSVKSVCEPTDRSTYPCFEAGTRCWWREGNLYTMEDCGHEYRYAPAFAVGLTPLAVLPTWLGGLLWNWIDVGLYFAALWPLMRWVLPGEWTPRRQGIYLLLVLLGSLRMLWPGQSNALVFALVGLGAVAIRRERWWTAAFLLAVPVHVKVWPLAAAMLFCACWPRRLTGRFALATLAVGLLPFLTKPFGLVCTQYQRWFDMLAGPAQDRHVYRDAWTIWELLYPPVDERLYTLLQLAAAAGVLGLCLWQKRRHVGQVSNLSQNSAAAPSGIGSPQAAVLTFILGLWAAWQLTFGPGTERNTFGLIAPLSAWALVTSLHRRIGRLPMVPAFVLMLAGTMGEIERAVGEQVPAVLAMHPAGVLLFTAWLCLCWAPNQTPSPSAIRR